MLLAKLTILASTFALILADGSSLSSEIIDILTKPLCVVCNGVDSLDKCKHFHLCNIGEQCYLQVFNRRHGHLLSGIHYTTVYYGGCTPKSKCTDGRYFHKRDLLVVNQRPLSKDLWDKLTCGECCEGENCNIHLCGKKSNVIFCAACDGAESVRQCSARTECPGQKCYLNIYERNNRKYVYGGCATALECRTKHMREVPIFTGNVLLNAHRGSKTCGACCNEGNHCNLNACDVTTTKSTTTTTTTTSKIPTTETTTTSTPTMKIHITQKTTTTTERPTTKPTTKTTETSTTQLTTTTTKSPTTAKATTGAPKATANATPPTTTTSSSRLKCETCSGPLCGLMPGGLTDCPAESAGCMNTVDVDGQGNVAISKRCVDASECHRKWYLETSDSVTCMNFDMMKVYMTAFTCHFCCLGDGCNSDVIPAHNTLYNGVWPRNSQ